MKIFITKLVLKYAFEYMVKNLTLQLNIPEVLYMNPYPTNKMIEKLKRE